MQPAAHSLPTPGVPLDAGEESLQEEPPADLHRYHHLQWTRVLLPERWVNLKHLVVKVFTYLLLKLELSAEALKKRKRSWRRVILIDLWLLLCCDCG